jgi:glyoxylase-like metal-dependent hydrolase (beta-lactamase superfamily II)
MFLWGDVIHNHATQLTKPDIGVEFDTDMSEAIAARKAILQKAADERWLIAGAHMPFPGIGRVRSVGGTAGYEWVPIEYESVR